MSIVERTLRSVDLYIWLPGKVAEIAKGHGFEGASRLGMRGRVSLLTRNFAIGACLLCMGTAFGSGHYTIRKGDTLSGIAHKLGVSEAQLLHANDLGRHHLKVGVRLIVPAAAESHGHSAASGSGLYKVKEGDDDERIASHFHLSTHQLHKLNPGIHWSALAIGKVLHVPGGHLIAAAAPKQTHREASHTPKNSAYTVRRGDNDLRIAKRMNISDGALKRANPGVDWDALQIGHRLNVPHGSSIVAERQTSHQIHSHYASISTDNVNVRRAPRSGSGLITTVDEGTRVSVLDHDGSWYKVRFPRGTKGWVKGDFLVAAVASHRTRRNHEHMSHYVADRSVHGTAHGDVLGTAHSLLGVPYRYGGNSRHGGLDCSAFTSTVYKSHGVTLPRTSREQSQVGRAVRRKDLQPGDLVFFHGGRSSRVNHVAIYEGHGKFIHASSGGGEVKESSLNEAYYNHHFVGGRRVAKVKASKVHAVAHTDPKHSMNPDGE